MCNYLSTENITIIQHKHKKFFLLIYTIFIEVVFLTNKKCIELNNSPMHFIHLYGNKINC